MENATLALIPCSASLSASSAELLAQIERFEEFSRSLEQIEIATEHVLHGGMYARTVRIPAGAVVTGALVNVPTLLVAHGDADVLTNEGWASLSGFCVLAGSAFRKQILVARSDVEVTMVFPTQARTVDEAEREFTDEHEKLMSRRSERDAFVVSGS